MNFRGGGVIGAGVCEQGVRQEGATAQEQAVEQGVTQPADRVHCLYQIGEAQARS